MEWWGWQAALVYWARAAGRTFALIRSNATCLACSFSMWVIAWSLTPEVPRSNDYIALSVSIWDWSTAVASRMMGFGAGKSD